MEPERIDWEKLAGEFGSEVRPETRSKYFPKNPLRQALIRGFLRSVGDAISSLGPTTILDVGAGEGFVDYYLLLRFPHLEITAVEPDLAARRVAARLNPRATFLEADARKLPFADASFDAAISIEVLEHLPDYREAMKELRRVGRGAAVISVPAFPYYQAANFFIGKNLSRLGEHPGHVVQFTSGKLKKEMSALWGPRVKVQLAFPWLIAAAGEVAR